MKEMQRLLSRVRFAADKYNMIEDGDHIVVGISGGKDSLALLCALAELRVFYPKKYTLTALTIDMGFSVSESIAAPKADYSAIRELCHRLDVPYVIKETEIARIVFDIRQESNPCSLCARMRRGVLHDEVKALGAKKLALGHHFDDAVMTTMLNLFFEGHFGCFSPVTDLSRKGLTMIRPFVATEEKEIKAFVRKANLPVIKSPCPADGNTERAYMKQFLGDFDHRHRGLYARIVGALERGEVDGWKETVYK
jgi:tRNA(Ile)-lysidine synthase TilS/MesJ